MPLPEEADGSLHISSYKEIDLPNEQQLCVSPPTILEGDSLLVSESLNLRSRAVSKKACGVPSNGGIKSMSIPVEQDSLNKKTIRIYSCSQCNFETYNRCSLRTHKLVNHSKTRYHCSHCSFKTKYKESLEGHLRTHDDENGKCFQCDMCPYKTRWRNLLANHKATHSDKKQRLCHICPYSTRKWGCLARHIKVVHNQGVYFECNKCDYKTLFKYEFTQHEKSHSGKDIFKCDKCKYIATSKENLRHHIRSHNRNLVECYDCGYKTHSKSTLKNHTVRHRNEKPYKCIDCSYTANTRTIFKAHLKKYKHSDAAKIKIFRCDVCDYETLDGKILMWHQKVHTGVRVFECHICEYKTESSCNFRKHEYVHERNKNKKQVVKG